MLTRTRGQPHYGRLNQKYFIFVTIAILIIAGGAIIWILNIEKVITGPWSSILGAIFTVLGAVLGLLQWYSQFTSEIPAAPSTYIEPQQRYHAQPAEIDLCVNESKGALVVYTKKDLRGTTINLTSGFDTISFQTHVATNVVERKIKNRRFFAGIFPSLEPGNYTVHINARQRVAKVTVLPGQVAEIDWR